ncbi:DUF6600 domain-containing protein [Xylophilus sp.]|uniref:DUF6600 domain-containing protein n=1 Tax=Xylophilus sp. TaxID=2653893 RepID=UPI0013B811B1|nr:DUF6600 domain-containing protein [Xylophilus sp.]KAF1049584.1 MAG: hypothetical protein GAK38_00683 [Xylophilus sp.]
MRLLPHRRRSILSPRHWPALLALVLGLGLGATAASAAEPPGRVARLSHLEGDAGYAPAGGTEWLRAEFNRPLTTGDQFSAAPGARAELHSGSTAIRLQGPARLGLDALDDRTTRLQLTEGALALRIRAIYPGERYEVGTPNLAFVAAQPGDYRFAVDPASGTTRVALLEGSGTVYGDGGQAQPLAAGQQAVYTARGLAVQQRGPAVRDGFDQWADARDRAEAQSISGRYVSPEIIGYQQLDAYGDWSSDPTYGNIWFPRVTIADWAPYRYGQWRWIDPWGWTWVDDAPWGFAPFHYGRWTQVGSRWGWVPGPRVARPAYAPALAGFIGSVAPGPRGNGAGRPAERWYPLAPGEAWRPGWRASAQYLDNVNRWNGPRPAPQAQPRFAREPQAISAWHEDRGPQPARWQQQPERRGFLDTQQRDRDPQRQARERMEQQRIDLQRQHDNDRRAQEWRVQRDQQERTQADRAVRERQFAEQAERQRRAQGEQQRQSREQQRQQGEQQRQLREQQRQQFEQQRQQRDQMRAQQDQQRAQREQFRAQQEQQHQQREQFRAQQEQQRAQRPPPPQQQQHDEQHRAQRPDRGS